MTFTDDDLKRLKEDLDHWRVHCAAHPGFMEALLARLESAEACIDSLEDALSPERVVDVDLGFTRLDAWRTTKGE